MQVHMHHPYTLHRHSHRLPHDSFYSLMLILLHAMRVSSVALSNKLMPYLAHSVKPR